MKFASGVKAASVSMSLPDGGGQRRMCMCKPSFPAGAAASQNGLPAALRRRAAGCGAPNFRPRRRFAKNVPQRRLPASWLRNLRLRQNFRRTLMILSARVSGAICVKKLPFSTKKWKTAVLFSGSSSRT